MIFADTSAWIDFFSGIEAPWTEAIGVASREHDLVVGDLVLVEILQGIRSEKEFRSKLAALSRFRPVALCGPAIAEIAAVNYCALRRRGLTVRGTIDVIIATWCIENDTEIIHHDRDLKLMEEYLGLRAYA